MLLIVSCSWSEQHDTRLPNQIITMPPTNNLLNPATAPNLSRNIVPMHSIVNEKMAIPERAWKSIKRWKSDLLFWEAESKYLHKLIRWNKTADHSYNGKIVCDQFSSISKKELPALIARMNTIENEIIVAMTENTSEIKPALLRFQKLEKELKKFKEHFSEAKLYLLEEMANTTRISIF